MHDLLAECDDMATLERLREVLTMRTGIDRSHLEAACALFMHGTFRGAANTLGMKHKTVTTRIASLEEQLGVRIFERRSNRVVPTPIGRYFITGVADEMSGFAHLVRTVRRIGDGALGHVAIGYCGPVTSSCVRELLFAPDPELPEVPISPVELKHHHVAASLSANIVDCAVVHEAPKDFAGTVAALWAEPLHLVLPDDHPLAVNQTIDWADIAAQTVLLTNYGPVEFMARLVSRRIADHGHAPRIVRADVAGASVMHMVCLGQGVALAEGVTLCNIPSGLVHRPIRFADEPERISTFLCWPERTPNRALPRFLKRLAVRIRERHAAAPPSGFTAMFAGELQ